MTYMKDQTSKIQALGFSYICIKIKESPQPLTLLTDQSLTKAPFFPTPKVYL